MQNLDKIKQEAKADFMSKSKIVTDEIERLKNNTDKLIYTTTTNDGTVNMWFQSKDTGEPYIRSFGGMGQADGSQVDKMLTQWQDNDGNATIMFQKPDGTKYSEYIPRVGKTSSTSSTKSYTMIKGSLVGKTLADRNNNPGNIRGPDGQFMKFATPEEGFQKMIQDITAKVTGNSGAAASKLGHQARTLRELISVYAPVEDNNDPNSYANAVAKQLGISPDAPVSQLQTMIPQLAQAMAKHEGFTGTFDLTKQPSVSAPTTPTATKVTPQQEAIKTLTEAFATISKPFMNLFGTGQPETTTDTTAAPVDQDAKLQTALEELDNYYISESSTNQAYIKDILSSLEELPIEEKLKQVQRVIDMFKAKQDKEEKSKQTSAQMMMNTLSTWGNAGSTPNPNTNTSSVESQVDAAW
jgi:hypothetical protein